MGLEAGEPKTNCTIRYKWTRSVRIWKKFGPKGPAVPANVGLKHFRKGGRVRLEAREPEQNCTIR